MNVRLTREDFDNLRAMYRRGHDIRKGWTCMPLDGEGPYTITDDETIEIIQGKKDFPPHLRERSWQELAAMPRPHQNLLHQAFMILGLISTGEVMLAEDYRLCEGHIGPSTTPESLARAVSPMYPQHVTAIPCNVLAERERCARLVETEPGEHCCTVDEFGNVIQQDDCTCWRAMIAAEIRRGR